MVQLLVLPMLLVLLPMLQLMKQLPLPPLLLLALDDELQRLTRSAQSLALASRGDGVRP